MLQIVSTLTCLSRQKQKKSIAIALALLGLFSLSHANEPLTFKMLIEKANAHYPALQAARLDHRAAIQEYQAARRLYWPTLSLTVEGTTHKNSSSAASKTLHVEQTLWDAGGRKAQVAGSEIASNLEALRVVLLQEEVHLQLANAWQNLLASHERIAVANQTIQRLQNYELQMQRRVEAEASPQIDLELTSSRIVQTQVELINAKNSLQEAINRIEQYTGLTHLGAMLGRQAPGSLGIQTHQLDQSLKKVDLALIVDHHPAVLKAKAQAAQSKAKLDQKMAEGWPQVYVRVSQPLSNLPVGYQQGPTAFVGIRYSSSAGFSNRIQAQALATRLFSSEEWVRGASTDLMQTLRVEQDGYVNSKARIQSLERSVEGSARVLLSYQRQFEGGRKNWQDLLNAVREMAQNQYALADAKAGLQGAAYRLQIRSGQMFE